MADDTKASKIRVVKEGRGVFETELLAEIRTFLQI
jgi:hypothetical protein